MNRLRPTAHICLILFFGGMGLLGALSCTRQESLDRPDKVRTILAEAGFIRMEIPFQGEMETRRVAMVSVGIQGSSVLTELAEEGHHVEKGDVVARLDSSQIEADLVRFEHDCERARQELESLEKAEIPLDILDMQAQLMAAESEWQAEDRFLEAATGLMERGLMSEGEIEQQAGKVAGLKAKLEQTQQRMELTQKHVHVARLAKAKAALAAAEWQRDVTRQQLEWCTLYAPESGWVVHVPLPIGAEYRPVHVGDLLYRNQVFLCIPDTSEYVVRGFAAEAELPWIRPGMTTTVTPVAFPHLRLDGIVESVGGMAQTRQGYPSNRKFFPVLISLRDVPEGLPTGLSVHVSILAGEGRDAPVVPRTAVHWRNGSSLLYILQKDGSIEEREVSIGLSDLHQLQVTHGLQPSERVLLDE